MSELLSQLGIDWHLLLSQAVNFFLLLIVLRVFVYKPLLKVLHERRARIEEGIAKAHEADERLLQVDVMAKDKLKAADVTAMGMLKKTEGEAKALEAKMLEEAKRKEARALEETQNILRAKEEESRLAMKKEAVAMVRQVIAKTVEMSPDAIDKALIERAVAEAGKAK